MRLKRYETIVKIETIRSLLTEGEYAQAQLLADELDPAALKKPGDVYVLAQAYKMNEQYETAQTLLLRLYEKRASRRLLEELLELSLLQKDVWMAEQYFEKYQKVSGGDPSNYIYEYRIGRLKGSSYEELLPLLQTLKEEQYMEKYAYELAKIYHKLGRSEECLAECSDLILWFGEGRYVEKAKALQAYYTGSVPLEDIPADQSEQETAPGYASFSAYAKLSQEEAAQEAAGMDAFSGYDEPEKEGVQQPEDGMSRGEKYAVPEPENRVPYEGNYAMQEPDAGVYSDTPVFGNKWGQESAAAEEAGMDAYARLMRQAAEMAAETEDDSNEAVWQPHSEQVETEPVVLPEEPAVLSEQEEMAESSVVLPEEGAELPDAEAFDHLDVSRAEQELLLYLEECGISLEDTMHTFASIPSVRSQLLQGLDELATKNPECYCMVVTGERRCGKTTFGKDVIKLLYRLSWLERPKVAMITGTKLNEMALEEKKAQLQGCCLIVEKAGRMTEETVMRLVDFIRYGNTLGMVILEDREKRIHCLLRDHPEWEALFSVRVRLPKYTAQDLLGFAVDYIKEQDYSVEEDAKVELGKKITELVRTEVGEGALLKALQLAKDALEHAEERNQEAILNMVEHGRFSANDVLLLKKTDIL